jgi:hypothetical protein
MSCPFFSFFIDIKFDNMVKVVKSTNHKKYFETFNNLNKLHRDFSSNIEGISATEEIGTRMLVTNILNNAIADTEKRNRVGLLII